MRRYALTVALIVVVSLSLAWLLALAAAATRGDWNNRLNDAFFRLRFLVKGQERVLPTIVHVDLTDAEVRDLGMKTGARGDFARLVNVLHDAGAQSILFDIIFPDPGSPEGDRQFADASRRAGTVYLPAILRTNEYRNIAGIPASGGVARWLWHPKVHGNSDAVRSVDAAMSYEALTATARGVGSMNSEPDADGLYRRLPLVFPFQDGFLPALALRAACDSLQVDPRQIEISFGRYIRLPSARMRDGTVRDIDIPIDRAGRMIIDYAGPWEASFPHYSFTTLLKAETDPSIAERVAAELEGAQVVVSDLTTSSSDYGPMPLERVYPRSGIHANVLNSILAGSFLRMEAWYEALLLALGFAALLWWGMYRLQPLVGSVVGLAGWVGLIGVQFAQFAFLGIMPALAAPTIGFVLALVAANVYRFFQAERERLRFRTRLERYFAPRLMSKILQSPNKLLSAEKKVITVLFSDISGFTSWCEAQPPEVIHATLNEYFELMTEIVFRHEGTVDKFIGDGLMAFFGDPLAQEDHSLRAVLSGIEMQQSVKRLRERWGAEGRMPIHVRIGINCGEVVVGDMGSRHIMAYTAIGSNINLGSRLESKAPLDGILVSASVYESVKGDVRTRFAGRITAKGIAEEFNTYEVIVPSATDSL